MLERARAHAVLGETLRGADAADLIGLNVQASSNDPSRRRRDLADIERLLQAGGIDLSRVREYFRLFDREKELDALLAGELERERFPPATSWSRCARTDFRASAGATSPRPRAPWPRGSRRIRWASRESSRSWTVFARSSEIRPSAASPGAGATTACSRRSRAPARPGWPAPRPGLGRARRAAGRAPPREREPPPPIPRHPKPEGTSPLYGPGGLKKPDLRTARSAKLTRPSPVRSACASLVKKTLFMRARSAKLTMPSPFKSASQALP